MINRILVEESTSGIANITIPGWVKADTDSITTQNFLSDNDDELIIIIHPNESNTMILATLLKFDGPMKYTNFTIHHDMSGETNLFDEIQLALNKNITSLFY